VGLKRMYLRAHLRDVVMLFVTNVRASPSFTSPSGSFFCDWPPTALKITSTNILLPELEHWVWEGHRPHRTPGPGTDHFSTSDLVSRKLMILSWGTFYILTPFFTFWSFFPQGSNFFTQNMLNHV